MSSKRSTLVLGWRVYGLGILALGLVCLAFGNFDPGQPVPKGFVERTALAYAAAAFMTVAGATIQLRRTVAVSAAALTAYFAIVVVVVMNGRLLLNHYGEFGVYSGAAEQLALAVGGLIVFATNADLEPTLAVRLERVGRTTFGLCAVLFGVAHFVYLKLTVPLVPAWLPPNQLFWAYATGFAHIAGGLALVSGLQQRLASQMLTIMYASFTPLVHLPMLLTGHLTQFVWSENALNLALTGAAWTVADSLRR